MTNEDLSAEAVPGSVEFSLLTPLRMLWKRRWLVLAIWASVTLVSSLVVRLLPAVYQAEALVLVDPQKIPDSFVSSTVKEDIVDRLALISQEIMSRTRLLKIIKDSGLYQEERKRLTEEEVVARMREDISVNFQKNWSGDRVAASARGRMVAFRLGYEGKNPGVVTKVTNQLANLYVAENVRSRENQSEGTVEFIDEQLDDAKKSLDIQEAKVSVFKQAHNGELPQQENSLLSAINGLQLQLQGTQDAINRATDEKMNVTTSLSAAETAEAAFLQNLQQRARSGGVIVTDSGVVQKTKLEILEDKLHELQLRYTPDHPDVQAMQREIAAEKRQAEQNPIEAGAGATGTKRPPALASNPAQPGNPTTPDVAVFTPELLRERERIAVLRSQLASLKRNIDIRTKQREEIIGQIGAYQSRINNLPLVEQQMAALTRDYQISQANYKSLLDKKFAAGLATDMEHSEKSERFKIVDAARFPEKPTKPNRILLSSICCVVGLVLGLAVAFGVEFRRGTLVGEWELPVDVPILGRVPVIAMSATDSLPRSGWPAPSQFWKKSGG